MKPKTTAIMNFDAAILPAMRRFSLITTLLLCSIFFGSFMISGCARQPREAGVLRLATGSDPSTLDPAKAYDTTSMSTARVLYRGLVDYGQGADIVAAVAREYSISPDGKVYKFKLRNDVHFHFDVGGKSPGRRVVAEDFRYAIERVLDPKTTSDGLSPFQIIDGGKEYSQAKEKDPAFAGHVRGIQVKGEDEISFTLAKTDLTFINWLTLPFAAAVPREWVQKIEKSGGELSENPNGCGPFRFVEWIHDSRLKIEKNPYYYDTSLPKSNGVELQIGGGDTLQMMRFELGDIDVYSLEETAAPDYLRLKRDPKWKGLIEHAPMMDVRYVAMNTELAPFNNKLVRQAVSYAVDKKRIVAIQAGRIEAAKGILPPGMPGYNANLKGLNYDPDKARALLKQAKYQADTPITFWYAETLWYPAAAQIIQENLKQIGMNVNLKKGTFPEVKTAAGQRRKIQMSIMGWLQDYPDPSNFLDVNLKTSAITETASLNRAFYSNPQVDKLLDAAAIELNRPLRLKMYGQAEQQIVNDAPWTPLAHTERYVAHQSWIEGYKLHPMWSARYEYVQVNR